MLELLRKRPIYKLLPFQILGILLSIYVDVSFEILISLLILLIAFSFSKFKQFSIPILIGLLSLLITQITNHSYTVHNKGLYEIDGVVKSVKHTEFNNRIIVSTDETQVLLIDKEKHNIFVGDLLKINGILTIPQPIRNPGQFDYKSYLSKQGISAICRDFELVTIKSNTQLNVNKFFAQCRNKISGLIDKSIAKPYSGFAKGLVLGAKDELDTELKTRFRDIGVVHILAVSGLHVGFILLILHALCSLLRIQNGWRVFLISLGLIFYMGLTGWPASVIRAGTMAILYIFGQYREKKIDPWNIVGCTAFGFLLFQPHSLFDLGFQLSFSAVVGILYVISRKPIIEVKFKRIGKWCENTKFRHIFDLFLVTMGAQLGTFIPISFYFGQIPVFAWIANLLIVPLTGFALNSALLSAILFPISEFISTTYGEASWGIMWLMDHFGILLKQCISLNYSTRGLSITLFFCVVILLLLVFSFQRKRYWQHIVIILLLGANIWVLEKLLTHDEVVVTFLDVGQGDAIVIEYQDKTILVDVGYKGFGKDYGKKVVHPFLNFKGIHDIELIVMSHPHADHIGGLSSILNEIKIHQIWDTYNDYKSTMYEQYLSIIDSLEIPIVIPKSGDIYKMKDMYLTVIYPDSIQSMETYNINNASIVFRLNYFENSILFTGDAELEAEAIIDNVDDKLNVDIIKCGHHGSKTSSSPSIVNFTSAEYCVVSAGEGNRYNHPSEEIMNRWKSAGTEILRTDKNGAIMFFLNGTDITLETMLK